MTRLARGVPLTGTAALARRSVSGLRRVPRPAVITSVRGGAALRPRIRLGKDHVGTGQAVRVAQLQEEASVRVEDVVIRRAAQRLGHGRDTLLATFDFDEHTTRRLIDRDDHILVGELLAILLVPEPD